MIEEHAVVTAILDNQDQHQHAIPQALLMLERKVACGICGQKRGCGNATFGKLLGHHQHGFLATNSINAKVGDAVIVGIEERILLRSILLMYVIPLIGMTLAALIANTFLLHELYIFLSALMGLFAGFLAAKRYLALVRQTGPSKSQDYQSVILRLDKIENPL